MSKKIINISEKYKKYINEFHINGQKYFCLCILTNKKTSPDEFLVSRDKKILVFKQTLSLIKYIKDTKVLYRQSSYKKWVNYIVRNKLSNQNSKIACATVKFNAIFNLSRAIENGSNLRSSTLMDALEICNMIDDYSNQTKSNLFFKEIRNKQLNLLIDLIYDNFIWIQKSPRTKKLVNFKKVSKKLNKLDKKFWNKLIENFISVMEFKD